MRQRAQRPLKTTGERPLLPISGRQGGAAGRVSDETPKARDGAAGMAALGCPFFGQCPSMNFYVQSWDMAVADDCDCHWGKVGRIQWEAKGSEQRARIFVASPRATSSGLPHNMKCQNRVARWQPYCP